MRSKENGVEPEGNLDKGVKEPEASTKSSHRRTGKTQQWSQIRALKFETCDSTAGGNDEVQGSS